MIAINDDAIFILANSTVDVEFARMQTRHCAGYIEKVLKHATGAEMDFVVKKGRQTVAIECKASTAPSVGKGTYFALDAIRPDAAYVVAPVDETYALNDRITAIPLSALGDIFV